MGKFNRLALMLAGASAAAVTPWPALAQCRLCEKPSTIPDAQGSKGPVRLEIETSLDFDRLILLDAGDGSAVMRPDGSTAAQGAVSSIGPRAMVGSAVVRGEPGRAVRVELPRRILLESATGAPIGFDEVASDLPALPRLDSNGILRFRFGGRLQIRGDADGEYRGDLPIIVEYL